MLTEQQVNEIADKLSETTSVDRDTIFGIFWMHSQRIRPNEDIFNSVHITEDMIEPLREHIDNVAGVRDEERLLDYLIHLDEQGEEASNDGNRVLTTYITMAQIVVMNRIIELI